MNNTHIKLLIVFALLLSFGGYLYYRIQSSRQVFLSWSVATGRILSIEVKAKPKQSIGVGGTIQMYWMVDILYEYSVEGKLYQGTRLSNQTLMESVDMHSKPSAALTSYIEHYKPYQKVMVHYDPKKPEKSFLEIH